MSNVVWKSMVWFKKNFPNKEKQMEEKKEEKKSAFGEALKEKKETEKKVEEQKAKFGEKMGDRTEKGMEGYCT